MSERRVELGITLDAGEVGAAFEVVVMRPGEANGLTYPPEVLRRAAPLFTGVTVFVNHADLLDRSMLPGGGRRVEDVAGVVRSSWWDEEGQCVRATLALAGTKGELVARLARRIVTDRERGLPAPNVGLSADMFVVLEVDGRTVRRVSRVMSLDVVFNPAAGGAFERVLNAVREQGVEAPGGAEMDERANEMSERRAEVQVQMGGEVSEIARRAAEEAGAALAEIERARREAEKNAREQLRASCASLLDAALQASPLPEPMKDEVRAQFGGRVFAAEELTAALERKEQTYARLVESAVIRGMGHQGPLVRGMKDSLERIQAAADMLLGASVAEDLRDTPRLAGLRELYIMLTGDYELHGVFKPERVQLANVTTTTMANVVKNALNKVLLESFNMNPKWWAPIVHEEDFGTMNQVTWITTGGFGDLPTVAEGDAYTELEWSDSEETADFVKKGGYVGITLEMIDRDQVGAVRAIPRRMGLAAYRTLSSLVSALFTANGGVGPTLADGKALFHADHGNLSTAAFSETAWDAVVQAMYKQTEATSLRRMGVRPAYCLVPIELEKAARRLFELPTRPADATTVYHEENLLAGTSRVITVPEWTDANDWAAAADPRQLQGVCIGYRFGREPEVFVANDPLTGSMFTNDEMRIKARFVVAVGIGDYRGLHKSNVT